MKTIKLLTLGIVLLTITLNGCKKDEQKSPANNSGAQASSKITKQLLDFRDNLKLKSGGSLPADSATWYLEGLLNYENANNNHQFNGIEFISDTLTIYASGSSLTNTELNEAYIKFTQKLNLFAQSKNASNFSFDAISIAVTPVLLKNGETNLIMNAGGGLNSIGIYMAFGLTDYWVWGNGGGKCGSFSGGSSDAAQELAYRFNHPIAGIPAGSGFFTDLESKFADGWEYPDLNNPGPYCDSKIFNFDAGNTGIVPCLSPTELNFYLSTFPFIVNDKKPPLKTFIDVSVTSYFPPNYTNIYSHLYKLNYGIFHLHSGSGN